MTADLRRLMWALEHCRPEQRERLFGELSSADQRALEQAWAWQARAAQDPPPGNWRTWLIMAGRGFGKTRTGAEWVLEQARRLPHARVALVGASIEEAARVMVRGESGLIACARTGETVEFKPSLNQVRLPNGGLAALFSGASPDGLRGPQHHFAWCDELAKWHKPQETWDMLQMGLRLGDLPRVLITTTPASVEPLIALAADRQVAVTGGTTFDNAALPPAFVEAMRRDYGASRLGRQELFGELLGEAEGALWTRDVLEACRRAPPSPEEIVRVVVGVDPPAGNQGDACGIIVCARTIDARIAVLADASVCGKRPDGWARAVSAAARLWGADRVIAESNNGGLMVEQVLRGAVPDLPIRLVHASRGKAARAEPVAAAFEAGRCVLAGRFPALEDQLVMFTAEGFCGRGSPDRADAMVWAVTALLKPVAMPRVRGL